MELTLVAVAEAHQGKGIGLAMMATVLANSNFFADPPLSGGQRSAKNG